MSRYETSSFALLGLLSIEPMSGYDMQRHLKDSMGHFWSESFGQIYPALKRLSTEGLVTSTEGRSSGSRQRQVYRITAQGRRHLTHWLGISPHAQQPRDEFVLKLFLGNVAPEGAVENHVRVHKAEQERLLAIYRAMYDYVRRERRNYPGQPFWLLLLERTIALRLADINWSEQTLELLAKEKQHRRRTKGSSANRSTAIRLSSNENP